MDEGLGERQPGLDAQALRLRLVGQSHGRLQGVDADAERTRGDRGRPGLRRRVDRRRVRLLLPAGPLPERELDGGTGRGTELRLGGVGPRAELPLGRSVVARQAVEPDQQGLVVLVQRAHHRSAYGEVARQVELATREVTECRLVQDRLRSRGEPASLREQPGVERRGMVDRDPVQEVGPEPPERDGVPPVPVDEDVGIHRASRPAGVSTTGSPSTTPPGPSPRRISARHQRSARIGSSASAKSNEASWVRVGGRSLSSRNASTAQLFRLRNR